VVTNGRHDALRRVLLSSNFSAESATELIRSGNLIEVLPGTRLIDPHSPVPFLALVQHGTLRLFIEHPWLSHRLAVAVLGTGDIVGWELLAGSRLGTFDLRASSYCRVLCVSPRALISLCTCSPRAAIQLTEAALRTMKSVQQAGTRLRSEDAE